MIRRKIVLKRVLGVVKLLSSIFILRNGKKSNNSGYIGHLTSICNLMTKSSQEGHFADYLKSYFQEISKEIGNQWKEIEDTKLQEINRKNSQDLVRNSLSSSSDSNTEPENVEFPSENDMHKKFADFNKNITIQHLPHIELNKCYIDFGQVAEGCQTNRLLKISTNDDDYDGQNYYILEISENAFKSDTRNEEICARLRQIFSLNKEASSLKLKFEKTQEINVCVNTCDLKIFGNLTTDQKPINIQTQILVYFAFGNTDRIFDKYLLSKLDVRLQLGYVRLKTYSTIDSIDFQIDKYAIESIKYVKIDIPHKKLWPISNAGNIPASLDCYLLDDVSLYGFKIKIQNSLIHLDASNKTQSIQLQLVHADTTNHVKNDVKQVSTKFMVQVRPNGFKYEVPLSIRLNEITLHNLNQTITSTSSDPSILRKYRLLKKRAHYYLHKEEVANTPLMCAGTIAQRVSHFKVSNLN
jgi:hypothetical protein